MMKDPRTKAIRKNLSIFRLLFFAFGGSAIGSGIANFFSEQRGALGAVSFVMGLMAFSVGGILWNLHVLVTRLDERIRALEDKAGEVGQGS